MTYDSIHECSAKIYASGMVVIYKKHSYGERTEEQLKWQAVQKRSYRISKSKVKSACIRAWQTKNSNNMLFITFTFPFDPTEKEAADIWNRLLKNLKQNYHVKKYVWVKERQKNGRLHYHIIIDRDRVGVINLQKSYNSAINHVRPDVDCSSNSVRLGTRPIIRNINSVAKYLSKYISKSNDENGEFTTKAYGYSDNMKISREIDTEELVFLCEKFGYNLLYSDSFFEIFVVNIDYIRFPIDFYENTS